MNARCATGLLLLSITLAPATAAAQDGQPENHGYFGAGLELLSNNSQTPLGDFSSTGAGIILNGAGIIGTGGGVGFGVNGGMGFGSRTDSDSDETIGDFQFGFDGGVVLADVFYLSVGLQLLSQTPDSTDVTSTYTVVPLGLGVLMGTSSGYLLGQLRFGGGELSNDQNSSTEDVDYFGIRLAGQTGSEDGLQFMGGLEFDTYDWTSVDLTDSYFRFFFGIGFGG